MKKVNKKLSLNKNVIASLNGVKGGNEKESNGQGCVSGGVGSTNPTCAATCAATCGAGDSCNCSGNYCTFLLC